MFGATNKRLKGVPVSVARLGVFLSSQQAPRSGLARQKPFINTYCPPKTGQNDSLRMGRWSVLWWAGSWQVVQQVGRLRVAQGLTSSHTYPTCHLPGSGPPSPTDDLGPAPAPPPALPPTSQASSSS